MSVEVEYGKGPRRVQDDTDVGFSARDREEANQGLDEVQQPAEVSPAITLNTGGAVNEESQIDSNCTN